MFRDGGFKNLELKLSRGKKNILGKCSQGMSAPRNISFHFESRRGSTEK
jgi:hypothetical protein